MYDHKRQIIENSFLLLKIKKMSLCLETVIKNDYEK